MVSFRFFEMEELFGIRKNRNQRKVILMKCSKRTSILAMFTVMLFLIFAATGIASADEETVIAQQAYREFFKAKGIDYDGAIKIFGEEEAPTACFLAIKAKTKPAGINKIFIKSNKNWTKVMAHFKISPTSLFLPVPSSYKVGPPYGKAYGYWAKHKKNPSYKIALSSADIFNLVGLNIIHAHFNTPVVDIMKLRGNGHSFKWIIKGEHGKGHGKAKVKVKVKGQGKGKGKKKK